MASKGQAHPLTSRKLAQAPSTIPAMDEKRDDARRRRRERLLRQQRSEKAHAFSVRRRRHEPAAPLTSIRGLVAFLQRQIGGLQVDGIEALGEPAEHVLQAMAGELAARAP